MLTGDWSTLMYDTIKANGVGAMAYFIFVIVFGLFMLLNLFLAVLLQKSGKAFMPGRYVSFLVVLLPKAPPFCAAHCLSLWFVHRM
eukprot:SAG22_NODE_8874_length_625_cov_0.781369_1_plen_85_part_10